MQQQNTYRDQLWREKAIDLYVESLDQGDMEGVAAVLEAAMEDPELEQLIREINLAYQEEEQLTPIARDAQLVRDLLQKHLPSAFETNEEEEKPLTVGNVADEEEEKPLTVGDVAKRLQDANRVSSADQDVISSLLSSSMPLPAWLSIQAVRQLVAELGITASERLLDIFRDTAITLSMGRSHNRAQLAAAREQRSRYKTRQSKPKQPDKQALNNTEPEKDK